MNEEHKSGADTAGSDDTVLRLSAGIVSTYVSNNQMPSSEIGGFIAAVHAAVAGLGAAPETPAVPEKRDPAVPVKKSVHDEYIVCLEDGKKFKSLKRHLMTHYKMTPNDYREKWNLPHDYPMVAPSYALARSRLAKQIGLGRKPGFRKTLGARTA